MRCVICRHGETREGVATITLERDRLTLVVRGVPARICEACGEDYVDEKVSERLLRDAEEAVRSGVRVEVRDYVAA